MRKNDPKKRILIIEDDSHIAEGIKLNLDLQGHSAMIAPNGPQGLALWKEWDPHLIVLDIMLPGIDGLSILSHIRLKDKRLPILILSAKGDAEDRIKGFSLGVDDYLAKPFNLEEFLLRVERLLLRSSWAGPLGGENEQSPPTRYSFEGNVIDFETFTAECRQGTIKLTEQEARLLGLFIANKGKPLSRKELLQIGWGYSGVATTRTVDNFIVRLRRYFEDDPRNPRFFKSIRNVGYMFDHR